MYSKDDFTYGMELELGDVRRDIEIPKHLGSWEYSETDVLNKLPPYKGICSDPLGIDPPVGGEINTKPTKTWKEQVERVMEIQSLFSTPTSSCISHNHVHVHVPGLKDDMDHLKRLTAYFCNWGHHIVPVVGDFKSYPGMKSKAYFKYDGGRLMPNWLSVNLQSAKDFEDYIRIYQCGKDGVSRGRPLRFAFNLYCLKHTNTIEFRFFRNSTDEREIADSLRFAEELVYAGLTSGESPLDILKRGDFEFPRFKYENWEEIAWKANKREGDVSLKRRTFYEAT